MIRKLFLSVYIALVLSAGFAFAGDKVNVNTATVEQLQSIKGVGAKTANAIIMYRKNNGEFKAVDELVNVKGIGQKKVTKLADQVSVSDSK